MVVRAIGGLTRRNTRTIWRKDGGHTFIGSGVNNAARINTAQIFRQSIDRFVASGGYDVMRRNIYNRGLPNFTYAGGRRTADFSRNQELESFLDAFYYNFAFNRGALACLAHARGRQGFVVNRVANVLLIDLRADCPVDTGRARASIRVGRAPDFSVYSLNAKLPENLWLSASSNVEYMPYIAEPWFPEHFAEAVSLATTYIVQDLLSVMRHCAF